MGIVSRLQTWWQELSTDPVGFLIYLLYFSVAILLTLILHEIAHGYVAYRCGDPTAKMLGRLSMDPRKHLDPVGTICLVLLGFGWAKPVPVNPRNFKNYRRDDFLVSIAGVTVNFTLFLLSLALAVGLNRLLWQPFVLWEVGAKTLIRVDASAAAQQIQQVTGLEMKLILKTPWLQHVQRFLQMFYMMNLSVAVFNLLPIPPLDGFHVVNDLLLKGRLAMNQQFFQIAQVAFMILCFTGALSGILSTVTGGILDAVLNLFLKIAGQA